MYKSKLLQKEKLSGFALIEVIIVFVIVILLAVMTVPIFKKLNERDQKAAASATESQLIEEEGMPK
jgi:Tfp pilus assembly protein PilE